MTSTHTSLSLTVDELSERILANLGAIHDCVVIPEDQPMAEWERDLAGLTFQEAYGFGQH